MSQVTRILSQIESGDPKAAQQLLPLVYEELRKLAAAQLAAERPGQSMDATGLVHEAYIRLVDGRRVRTWNGRGHFFGAAAKAMRRILVDNARRKQSLKRGGEFHRKDIPMDALCEPESPQELLAIDEALEKLATENAPVAKLVELRHFAGLTLDEASAVLEISSRTGARYWTYAKAWLLHEIRENEEAT